MDEEAGSLIDEFYGQEAEELTVEPPIPENLVRAEKTFAELDRMAAAQEMEERAESIPETPAVKEPSLESASEPKADYLGLAVALFRRSKGMPLPRLPRR